MTQKKECPINLIQGIMYDDKYVTKCTKFPCIVDFATCMEFFFKEASLLSSYCDKLVI